MRLPVLALCLPTSIGSGVVALNDGLLGHHPLERVREAHRKNGGPKSSELMFAAQGLSNSRRRNAGRIRS